MTTLANQLLASVFAQAAKDAAEGRPDDAACHALEAAQTYLLSVEPPKTTCEQCGGPLDDGKQPCDRCLFSGPMGPTEDDIREHEKERR